MEVSNKLKQGRFMNKIMYDECPRGTVLRRRSCLVPITFPGTGYHDLKSSLQTYLCTMNDTQPHHRLRNMEQPTTETNGPTYFLYYQVFVTVVRYRCQS